MTEHKDNAGLTHIQQKFILHWGEMGDKWGVNRSVAQIHALLYIAAKPLSAEDISETLEMARSNVSTSIRELLDWGIIKAVHKVGERKEHFEALADPWETLDLVLRKRREREIEPTIRLLADCIAEAEKNPKEDKHVGPRLQSLRDLIVQGDALFGAMRRLPRESISKLIKTGSKLKDLLTAR
jgi:DNA-binding transcriptional regulator GbsR (MarR family)